MKDKKSARRKAIKSLKSQMKERDLSEDLAGKMSVKVVADDPEAMAEGLDKAKETVKSLKSGDMQDFIKAAMKSKKSK